MASRYAERFRDDAAAREYDDVEYGPASYATHIWKQQVPILRRVLNEARAERGTLDLLDFACGTGRILETVAADVRSLDGVDISDAMADVARRKTPRARIIVGDLAANPDLVKASYDVVTCFRYLLNTEPEDRRRTLAALHRKLVERDGFLIANVHGNTMSLRHFALLYRRLARGEVHSEMSVYQARTLFEASGFRIEALYGFGLLPPFLYRTPLVAAVAPVDEMLSRLRLFAPVSIDLLFVCRPR